MRNRVPPRRGEGCEEARMTIIQAFTLLILAAAIYVLNAVE